MRDVATWESPSDKLYTVFVLACLVCLLLLFGLGFMGCAAAPPAHATPPGPPVDHTITVKWNQSFVNNPACSAAVTASCISGFNEGYLDTTGKQVQQHVDTSAACAGATQPEACATTYNGVLPIGQVTFYVATTYLDQAGAAGVTAAGTSAPVAVGADSSTNVTVIVGP